MTSPYARFQLFRNPFGELTVDERAKLAVVDDQRCLEWLEHSPRAVLQVMGPCGHGKSTHLRALQFAWASRQPSQAASQVSLQVSSQVSSQELPSFVYFPEEGDQPALPRSRPLFVDEAQRMRWRRRNQMLRGPGPLVLGTHQDMSRELKSAGFQLLTIDLDQPMSPQRLQELLNRRILASRVNGDSDVGELWTMKGRSLQRVSLGEADLMLTDLRSLFLSTTQVVALQQRFGSNIRQIEDYLYEQFQSFVLKGEPWLPVE